MSKSFDELVAIMARLRAPGGCPWDHEQTYASLAQYLLEESYETFDAIQEADQTGDTANLREELGDLLLQVVFHSTIGAERGSERIAVEISSFVADSPVRDLQEVVGQFVIYRALLAKTEPDRSLFLAVSTRVYDSILSEPIGQLVAAEVGWRVMVFDPTKQEVVRWIS